MPNRPIFLDDIYEHPPDQRPPRRERDRYPPAQRCVRLKKNGQRCRRFATRSGTNCSAHQESPDYRDAKKRDAKKMVEAQQWIKDARELMNEVHAELRESAADAVRNIREMANDTDLAPGIRLRANELLVRHSGGSLERLPQTVQINVGNSDVTAVIRERLDRLQAAGAIAGELESAS